MTDWKKYRYIIEYAINVNFKKYKSDIHFRELEIINETEDTVDARLGVALWTTTIYKDNAEWADIENREMIWKAIQKTVKKKFNVNKFSFRIFILSKTKIKEKRLKHVLTNLVKVEINNIRTKGLKKQ